MFAYEQKTIARGGEGEKNERKKYIIEFDIRI
jgi:hypothetical protein